MRNWLRETKNNPSQNADPTSLLDRIDALLDESESNVVQQRWKTQPRIHALGKEERARQVQKVDKRQR